MKKKDKKYVKALIAQALNKPCSCEGKGCCQEGPTGEAVTTVANSSHFVNIEKSGLSANGSDEGHDHTRFAFGVLICVALFVFLFTMFAAHANGFGERYHGYMYNSTIDQYKQDQAEQYFDGMSSNADNSAFAQGYVDTNTDPINDNMVMTNERDPNDSMETMMSSPYDPTLTQIDPSQSTNSYTFNSDGSITQDNTGVVIQPTPNQDSTGMMGVPTK
jgi:hypothetical protein